jgi:hypothetical protein
MIAWSRFGNLAILLSLLSAASASANSAFVQPYKATYSTIWQKGINFKVVGEQTLSQGNDNNWFFSFQAKTLLASLEESVSFQLIDQHIQPLVYHYKSKIFGKKREALLTFDWQSMRVKNDVQNKPWKMDIHQGTLDRLGVQLQLRQDLKAGKDRFQYQIADGGHLKDWSFAKIGVQTIRTDLGELETLKVVRTDNQSADRQSVFFFAPKYDFLLVRMKHIEDGESYLLEIESINEDL